jgi:KDO2-lipid IV(A) lauroyltransferase
MKHRPRYVLEYLLLRFFQFFLANLPYRAALFLGWCAAVFTHFVMRYRVAEACRRMEEVFPGRYTARQKGRMAWRSWRDFAFSVVDLFRLPAIDQRWIERYVIGHGEAKRVIMEHCRTGTGAVITSAHMGAAEVASVLMQRFGVPIFLITGRQSNPLVDGVLNEIRSSTGIPTVQRGSALLRSVVGRLKKGEVLAFLADLRVAPSGTVVDFLGADASVAPGMAKFAKQTGVPIFPLVTRRVGWTRHSLEFAAPVFPEDGAPKADDCQRMTQAVFDVYDRAIRETPEQWFWFNKRWILDPP